MIKQIKSSEIKSFVENNPKTVLLDVRTNDEWKTIGKPDTTKLGIKTFFITISQDSGFIENIKKEKLLLKDEALKEILAYKKSQA